MDNTCDVFHHEGDWEANHITSEAVLHFVAAFVPYLFKPGCLSKCRSYTQTRAPLLSSGLAESGKTDCLLRGTSHQDPASVNAEMRCVIGVACIAGWDIQRHPASLQLAPAYSGPLFSRAAPGADYPCPLGTSQGLFSFLVHSQGVASKLQVIFFLMSPDLYRLVLPSSKNRKTT